MIEVKIKLIDLFSGCYSIREVKMNDQQYNHAQNILGNKNITYNEFKDHINYNWYLSELETIKN